MGSSPNVIRIPRQDPGPEDAEFVIIHAKPSGRRLLDLDLLGTEDTVPFYGQLKHRQLEGLKGSSCPLDDVEWESVLASLFLGHPWPDSPSVAGIDTLAVVEKDKRSEPKSMTIQIKKHVQGITQRLGAITLEKRKDMFDNVELFSWCGVLAESRFKVQTSLEEANAKVDRLEAAVAGLKEQLEEFVRAKDSDETVLLEKFKILLNEKKVKIREQHKLLEEVKQNPALVADPSVGEASGGVEDGPSEVKVKAEPMEDDEPAAPARSRKGNRKAPAKRAPTARGSRGGKRKISQVEQESESGGLEDMDVDNSNRNDGPRVDLDSEDEDRRTEDEGTADEAETDDEPVATRIGGGSSKAQAVRGSQDTEPMAGSVSTELEMPPPRRELPFAINKGRRNAPAAASSTKNSAPLPQHGGSETDSDDEL
ncbi:hypothetical protein MKZ38_000676 [Zalerion maritima]|uniref:XRCC4 coiled-coil domain-containing protein n=1 Tax=Zalerion maritima TaxID=339359 RepID=A0AAD5WUB2_9PEZI|nr:hypothetical protein MKZ38_000676 [Zalerion maritima]